MEASYRSHIINRDKIDQDPSRELVNRIFIFLYVFYFLLIFIYSLNVCIFNFYVNFLILYHHDSDNRTMSRANRRHLRASPEFRFRRRS